MIFELEKQGHGISFRGISFVDKDFYRALNAQIKIWTFQDRTLRTREVCPFLSKADNSKPAELEYLRIAA